MPKFGIFALVAAAALLLAPPSARATELVYTPINPSFGGFPGNGPFLLEAAEEQSKFKEPVETYSRDPMADFEESLNRRILGILANSIVDAAFGEAGLEGGHFVIGDYVIDVAETADGVDVVVSDPANGRQTTITIPNF
jgi:curli production assembly/transport component CsgF